MRFLVSTRGKPFQPQIMPSMSIKTAEGFADESNCFHTMIITSIAKRVSQIPAAIQRYNRTTVEKMSLAVDANGLERIVIFPGKTSYKDNKIYKKISEANAMGNSTYWSWKAPVVVPGSEEEQMVMQVDDKQIREELEDELVMVNAENKRVRENLEAELAKVKRARLELEAELAAVKTENTRACEENQRLRGELEESQNLHGGLKQMRFCCG